MIQGEVIFLLHLASRHVSSLACHAQESDLTTGARWFNMRAPEMTRVTKGRPQSTENARSSGPQVDLQEDRHRWIPQVFPGQ